MSSVSRECSLSWQIAPGISTNSDGPGRIFLRDGDRPPASLSFFPSAKAELSSFSGSLDPVAGWYFPAYGEKVPKTDLRLTWPASGEAICATWIDFLGEPECVRREGANGLVVAHSDGWRLALAWEEAGSEFPKLCWQVQNGPQMQADSLPEMAEL